MMEGALIAIFAFLAALYFSRRAQRATNLLRCYEHCMNALIEDAETLMSADETPAPVVDLIDFIVKKATERRSAFEFLLVVIRHRKELATGPAGETALAINEFKKSNPHLSRVLSRAMGAGLLAMTYKGGFVGTFLRRLVLFDAEQHGDRSQDLAAGFREVESIHAT